MRAFAFIIFLSCSFSIVAQKKNPKFGSVSMEEMNMTSYAGDSSAAAVILFDQGETSLLQTDFKFSRHVRIKIFNKEAFRWADFTGRIPHTMGVTDLKGSTFNLENGKIAESQMDPKSIFKSKFNRSFDQVSWTLPNVKEGSIIEYSYSFVGKSALLSWRFQYTLPVIFSQYEAFIPQYVTFDKNMQGSLSLSKHEENSGGGYELFVMENIPAFKEEPFTTTPEDYVSKITFYLAQIRIPGREVTNFSLPWDQLAKEIYGIPQFGGQIKNSDFLQEKVDEVTKGITEPQRKIQAIYDYIKTNVSWNDQTDLIPFHLFKKVFEDKKGSSSEINLLLVTMLRKAGFSANPVFISTRSNGLVRPTITQVSQFNDLICVLKTGEKQLLMDATNKDLPMAVLPERCLNGSGMVVMENGVEWIALNSVRSKKVIHIDLKLDKSGEINGQLNITRDGLAAGTARKLYRDLGEAKYTNSM